MNDVLMTYDRNKKRNVKFSKTKIYTKNEKIIQIKYSIQSRTYVAETYVQF